MIPWDVTGEEQEWDGSGRGMHDEKDSWNSSICLLVAKNMLLKPHRLYQSVCFVICFLCVLGQNKNPLNLHLFICNMRMKSSVYLLIIAVKHFHSLKVQSDFCKKIKKLEMVLQGRMSS